MILKEHGASSLFRLFCSIASLKIHEVSQRLRRHTVEGNVDHIQKVAHKIAGSGGSYGLPEISRLGKEIELAAEKNNPQELKELLDTFTDYLESIEVVYKD